MNPVAKIVLPLAAVGAGFQISSEALPPVAHSVYEIATLSSTSQAVELAPPSPNFIEELPGNEIQVSQSLLGGTDDSIREQFHIEESQSEVPQETATASSLATQPGYAPGMFQPASVSDWGQY